MDGLIFDIQRFSVHDGPGIRTTVFMKGCPLRCRWCHNPEGLLGYPQLQFFKENCLGCQRCRNRESLSDAEKCPSQALRVVGKKVSSGEIVSEILKDRAFYGTDGGVTFSGGECLLQADFVREVLEKAKEHDLTTCIDTSGCVPWEEIEKTISVCDLYLYDVKCITKEIHKKFTGRENGLILENLIRLSKRSKAIWLRIPVIPGFNDTRSEMEKIVSFLLSVSNIQSVTLIPYHTLGASKYRTLGLEIPFPVDQRVSESFLKETKTLFINSGLPVQA